MAFLGVPGRDNVGAHRAFVERHGLGHFPHAMDEDRTLWAHFGIAYQDAWVFINDDGSVFHRSLREIPEDDLRALLDRLIAT